MKQVLFDRSFCVSPWLRGIFGLISMSVSTFATAETSTKFEGFGPDDVSFVFMGRCPNGVMYRLKAYDQKVEGSVLSFYDYEGPAGHGTIQSKTAPKIIAVRVCRPMAEIASDS